MNYHYHYLLLTFCVLFVVTLFTDISVQRYRCTHTQHLALQTKLKESWIFSDFHSLAFQASSTFKGIWPSLISPADHHGWGVDVFVFGSSLSKEIFRWMFGGKKSLGKVVLVFTEAVNGSLSGSAVDQDSGTPAPCLYAVCSCCTIIKGAGLIWKMVWAWICTSRSNCRHTAPPYTIHRGKPLFF